MTDTAPDVWDSAVAWHIAMPTMTESHWHAFTEWLEADPAHASAYDAVALADARLAEAKPSMPVIAPPVVALPAAALQRQPLFRTGRRPLWIGGALAASLAALVAITTQIRTPQDSHYSVTTVAGSTRTIAMGEGSAVTLNGDTRMAFDKSNPRSARLDEGEALFSVRHDASKPFEVAMGRFRVVDLGTVFNIVRSKGRLSIAVSEGRVLFDPKGANLTLGPGDAITVDEGASTVTRGKAQQVGGWRNGEMEFTGTPLSEVAAAIHRRTGAQIVISAPLSNTPFTGNVRVTGDAARDARHLAQLVGTDVTRDGEKWLLSSSRAAD
ncbi:MAG TPA: FecR domain-containing protein [Sphingobium sp.]|uniref:FecR family protein n=1 Tax=Sphingobium sp. TaxID=1912891 RepID=UPI002ED08B25